jgi:NAD(P)-dependent dehydrogenase (short-subunit alcohol dehydrogenase family)
MTSISLHDNVAVVTGAGSGIGRAIAEVFAQSGASVHAIDFDHSRLNSAVSHIKDKGQQVMGHQCDVSNLHETTLLADLINVSEPITILVNCAGVAHVGNVESTSEEDFDRLFRVNVKGYFNFIRASIPHMKARRNGTILNIASIAACVGIANRFAYSMSKGAVLAMTYSVAKDYVSDGIRCNCISPARVYTPFVEDFVRTNYPGREEETMAELTRSQPIGRMGTTNEIATLALYLCSDHASFMTGANYLIDGGVVSLSTR